MPGKFFPALVAGLTPTRLTGYRVNPAESDVIVISRYVWNMELGAALHASLHLLEIGLRNRLDSVLTLRDGATWFDDPLIVVEPSAQTAVADAKARLLKDGKVVSPPGVIATLDFGFWTSLFNRAYEQGPGRPVGHKSLWPSLLPSVARGRSRGQLAGRFNELRKLRNRVFHYEPIWKAMSGKPLRQLHQELIETIGWIDADLARLAVLVDEFPLVLAAGFDWYKERLLLLDV